MTNTDNDNNDNITSSQKKNIVDSYCDGTI